MKLLKKAIALVAIVALSATALVGCRGQKDIDNSEIVTEIGYITHAGYGGAIHRQHKAAGQQIIGTLKTRQHDLCGILQNAAVLCHCTAILKRSLFRLIAAHQRHPGRNGSRTAHGSIQSQNNGFLCCCDFCNSHNFLPFLFSAPFPVQPFFYLRNKAGFFRQKARTEILRQRDAGSCLPFPPLIFSV